MTRRSINKERHPVTTRTVQASPNRQSIARLRDEVHQYHIDVVQSISEMKSNCKHCRETMSGLDLQINGEKPERDDAPSVMRRLGSLEGARKHGIRSIQIAWTVVTVLAGLLLGIFKWK